MTREVTGPEAAFLDGIRQEMSAERWLEHLQEFTLEATLASARADLDDGYCITDRSVTLLGTMHALIFHFRALAGGYKEV